MRLLLCRALRSQGVFSPVPIARLDETTAKENDALRKEVRFTELSQHGGGGCCVFAWLPPVRSRLRDAPDIGVAPWTLHAAVNPPCIGCMAIALAPDAALPTASLHQLQLITLHGWLCSRPPP